jgi:hypothetical protein
MVPARMRYVNPVINNKVPYSGSGRFAWACDVRGLIVFISTCILRRLLHTIWMRSNRPGEAQDRVPRNVEANFLHQIAPNHVSAKPVVKEVQNKSCVVRHFCRALPSPQIFVWVGKRVSSHRHMGSGSCSVQFTTRVHSPASHLVEQICRLR